MNGEVRNLAYHFVEICFCIERLKRVVSTAHSYKKKEPAPLKVEGLSSVRMMDYFSLALQTDFI